MLPPADSVSNETWSGAAAQPQPEEKSPPPPPPPRARGEGSGVGGGNAADKLAAAWAHADAVDIVSGTLARFAGRIVLVSSFGADSAVLLHMVATIDRTTPVLFVDTLRLFPETLAYRDELITTLRLANVRSIGPSATAVAHHDPSTTLAETDPDACCALRKVAPLDDALVPFDAWITGRRRDQATTRAALPAAEWDGARVKINPLVAWTDEHVAAYRRAHDLPAHPLAALGFVSIGCWPCTSPVAPGEDPRAGRWRGFTKTECGIHRPAHDFSPPPPGGGRSADEVRREGVTAPPADAASPHPGARFARPDPPPPREGDAERGVTSTKRS
jgi:phosphoadenosine phosphosulfate reductase